MANQVTLTFAGETSKLEQSMGRVSAAGDDMNRKVGESGEKFGKASEGFDKMDTRAMGFRDTLTGLQDGAQGIKKAAAGDWGFETLLLLGFGLGDLASGMVNAVIPAVKALTSAQWLNNLAFLASPITWIIVGITALIAVIVLIALKTDWFSKAWRASWGWIKRAASNTWDFLKKIPGWTAQAFAKVAEFITAPYRAAFNMIASAWNATIGRLSWTVPAWVPGIGGNTISVPHLPHFHSGGVVPGTPGSEQLAVLQAGERVSTRGGGDRAVIEIHSGGTQLDDLLVEVLSRAVRRRGGNVQLALGGRNA